MNVIIFSALLGVLMMFAGIVLKKSSWVQLTALVGIIVLMGASIFDFQQASSEGVHHYQMIWVNKTSTWFNLLMTFCTLIYFFIFHRSVAKVGRNDSEYFALLFFIMSGVYMLSGYTNLLMLFIGIEILSIPQYILAGTDKENLKSNEASLKYFLMGSFSTGILLMGITLLYGSTGTFDITSPEFISKFQMDHMNTLGLVGIVLMVISFGFKVSAAPMHFWTPDVYDGTPTAFTPFMATITKVSVFVAFIKLFHGSFGQIGHAWQMALAAMIVLTLLIGNVTAVYQMSVKRMMAYSSIAQAGFMLFAVFATNETAWKGIMIYSVAYTLASFGVFAVLIKLKDYSYDGFNGLAKKEPLLALTATICLLSLAGIPLTSGFFAKYMVLSATVEQGKWIGLIIFAVLMAAISVYYYFKVIMAMYFKPEENTEVEIVGSYEKALLIINATIVVLLGVLPQLSFFN